MKLEDSQGQECYKVEVDEIQKFAEQILQAKFLKNMRYSEIE